MTMATEHKCLLNNVAIACETTHEPARNTQSTKWNLFPKRYLMAILSFVGFFNIYGIRVNLSIAIIKMVEKTIKTWPNGTLMYTEQEFDWGKEQQGILLGSFFWGYFITSLPGGLLALKFGGKSVFCFGVLSTSVLTLLTPLITHLGGFKCLIILRVLEGLGEGVAYPAMHAFWSKWAPLLERTKLMTISMCGSQIGIVISMPLCSLLADYYGWESIFYTYGSLGLLWTFLWHVLASESPENHPSITNEEMQYIVESRSNDSIDLRLKDIPWRQILTSKPIHAIIAVHFSEMWGIYTLLTELPTYMKRVLHFDLKQSGFLSAIPYLVFAAALFLVGQLSDYIRRENYMQTLTMRKLFITIGFCSQIVFLLATTYAENCTAAVTFLIFGVGFGGFVKATYHVNHLDISPRYACIIMGVSAMASNLAGILSPSITGYIVTGNTIAEWRIVFQICCAINAFGVIMFAAFSSAQLQSWNSLPESR